MKQTTLAVEEWDTATEESTAADGPTTAEQSVDVDADNTGRERVQPQPVSNYASSAAGEGEVEREEEDGDERGTSQSPPTETAVDLAERDADVYWTAAGECIDRETGEVIATDYLDRGPDWRAFDAFETEQNRRIGQANTVTLHDRGLGAGVGYGTQDANGNYIPVRKQQRLDRLRTRERHNEDSNEQEQLRDYQTELLRIAAVVGCPRPVHERAAYLLREWFDLDDRSSLPLERVASAAIYIAALEHGIPLLNVTVADASGLTKHEVQRAVRYLRDDLGVFSHPPTPVDLFPRIEGQLDLPAAVSSGSRQLTQTITSDGFEQGRNPAVLATACIRAIGEAAGADEEDSGYDITYSTLSAVAGVSGCTIRDVCSELAAEYDVDAYL